MRKARAVLPTWAKTVSRLGDAPGPVSHACNAMGQGRRFAHVGKPGTAGPAGRARPARATRDWMR